jgi:hypothetical protein
MLELLKQGAVDRDMRLKAAQGTLAVAADENLSILVRLLRDDEADVRMAAAATLGRLPDSAIDELLTRSDVPDAIRDHFVERRTAVALQVTRAADQETADRTAAEFSNEVSPDRARAAVTSDPPAGGPPTADEAADRESIHQKLTQMGVPERVKAAVTGSREMRALLIRDPNRMISSAVLASPKLTEAEVETFARMGNVSEDVLRIIGSNRAWIKNYGVMMALVKNAKTPLAISLSLMHRLADRDLVKLAVDRNVMEPLRIAAKRKVGAAKAE